MITLPGEFQTFFNSEKIYTPDQISDVLKEVRPFFRFSWSNKKLKYFFVWKNFFLSLRGYSNPTGLSPNKATKKQQTKNGLTKMVKSSFFEDNFF